MGQAVVEGTTISSFCPSREHLATPLPAPLPLLTASAVARGEDED